MAVSCIILILPEGHKSRFVGIALILWGTDLLQSNSKLLSSRNGAMEGGMFSMVIGRSLLTPTCCIAGALSVWS